VHDAVERFTAQPPIAAALRPVNEVGLGYLRLGEPTPSLSGGESQRLKIASRLRSSQQGALYVFDEPTTGLHPLDVGTLVGVFDQLLDAGATIIVIDHDLDLLAAADYLIDMGPGGGPEGGRILATGTPADVARDADSVTAPWLAEYFGPSAAGRNTTARSGMEYSGLVERLVHDSPPDNPPCQFTALVRRLGCRSRRAGSTTGVGRACFSRNIGARRKKRSQN